MCIVCVTVFVYHGIVCSIFCCDLIVLYMCISSLRLLLHQVLLRIQRLLLEEEGNENGSTSTHAKAEMRVVINLDLVRLVVIVVKGLTSHEHISAFREEMPRLVRRYYYMYMYIVLIGLLGVGGRFFPLSINSTDSDYFVVGRYGECYFPFYNP